MGLCRLSTQPLTGDPGCTQPPAGRKARRARRVDDDGGQHTKGFAREVCRPQRHQQQRSSTSTRPQDITFRHDARRDRGWRCCRRARRDTSAPAQTRSADHADRRVGSSRYRCGVWHQRPDVLVECSRAAHVGMAGRSRSLLPLARRTSCHAGAGFRATSCLRALPARTTRGRRGADRDCARLSVCCRAHPRA